MPLGIISSINSFGFRELRNFSSDPVTVTVTGGLYYVVSTTPLNGYNYLLIYPPETGTTTYSVTFSGQSTFVVGVLVIGGGGGGGSSSYYSNGYGGSGGGVYYTPQQATGFTFTNSTYTVVIGSGGILNSSAAGNTGGTTTLTGNINGTECAVISATGGAGISNNCSAQVTAPQPGTSCFSGSIGTTVAISASGGTGKKTGDRTFNTGPNITLETGSIISSYSCSCTCLCCCPSTWPTIVSGDTFADGSNSSLVLGSGNPGTYYGCGGNGANNGNVTSRGAVYPGQNGYGGLVLIYWK